MLCILVKIVYFYFKQMIMAKYKYPWIYIQELSSSFLPQSKDDTAVFIGYTEMHENQEGQNLHLIPTLIDSVKSFGVNAFDFIIEFEHLSRVCC